MEAGGAAVLDETVWPGRELNNRREEEGDVVN
jgi:hypothetical protein